MKYPVGVPSMESSMDFSVLADLLAPDPIPAENPKPECVHAFIDRVCRTCGEEEPPTIQYENDTRYIRGTDRGCARRVSEQGIYQDLVHIQISDRIKDLANEIYHNVCIEPKKIHRGKFRKAIIFAAVFHAYKIVGSPQCCEQLMRVFEIDRKSVMKGIKYIDQHIPKDSPLKNMRITTEDLVQKYMAYLSATNAQTAQVLAIYQAIHEAAEIKGSRPQSIASGVIYYYSLVIGRPLNLKDFHRKVDLSELTILKTAKACSKIFNTPQILNFV